MCWTCLVLGNPIISLGHLVWASCIPHSLSSLLRRSPPSRGMFSQYRPTNAESTLQPSPLSGFYTLRHSHLPSRAQGQIPDNKGQLLCPTARWNYSNNPVLIYLPHQFLPMEAHNRGSCPQFLLLSDFTTNPSASSCGPLLLGTVSNKLSSLQQLSLDLLASGFLLMHCIVKSVKNWFHTKSA